LLLFAERRTAREAFIWAIAMSSDVEKTFAMLVREIAELEGDIANFGGAARLAALKQGIDRLRKQAIAKQHQSDLAKSSSREGELQLALVPAIASGNGGV
jgi:hypothetical protein